MRFDISQLNYFKQCPLKLMLMNTLRNVFSMGGTVVAALSALSSHSRKVLVQILALPWPRHFYVVFACPLSATSVLPQSKDMHVKLIHKCKLAVGSSSPESVYIDSFWLKVHKF